MVEEAFTVDSVPLHSLLNHVESSHLQQYLSDTKTGILGQVWGVKGYIKQSVD